MCLHIEPHNSTHNPIYAGCVSLASNPSTHLLQDRVPGVAVLVWLGAILSARALPPSLFLCRPSYTPVLCPVVFTVIWLSHLPGLLQCRLVLFLWLVQQRGMDFQ